MSFPSGTSAPLTPDELRVLRSRISMTLANLGECRIFWHVTERRIAARSVYVERQFRVPAGAVLVGTYRHGVAIADVLGDLAELLERLPEPPPAPEAEPLPPITALEWLHHVAPARGSCIYAARPRYRKRRLLLGAQSPAKAKASEPKPKPSRKTKRERPPRPAPWSAHFRAGKTAG